MTYRISQRLDCEHGHGPGRAARHQLAQQACLDTRAAAEIMRPVPGTAVGHSPAVPPGEPAQRAVAHVARQRSTWTVPNLRAETERLLPGHTLASLAADITTRAVDDAGR